MRSSSSTPECPQCHSTELAKQLAQKAKEGVDVKVIYDAVGSGRADPKMFQMMKDAGVDLLENFPTEQIAATFAAMLDALGA